MKKPHRKYHVFYDCSGMKCKVDGQYIETESRLVDTWAGNKNAGYKRAQSILGDGNVLKLDSGDGCTMFTKGH